MEDIIPSPRKRKIVPEELYNMAKRFEAMKERRDQERQEGRGGRGGGRPGGGEGGQEFGG